MKTFGAAREGPQIPLGGPLGTQKFPKKSYVAGPPPDHQKRQGILVFSQIPRIPKIFTSQKIAIEISEFTEISGNCKWSWNTNVSGEGFPARAQKIQNGILRNPPGTPNGAFLTDRAGIRKVLWKLLEISIFNPERLGTSHFT